MGAGTAGGVLGGLLAERGAAWFGVDALLFVLSALHAATALTLRRVPAAEVASGAQSDSGPLWPAARQGFRQAPFLVLQGTMSATLLDFLFKSGASAEFGKGPSLPAILRRSMR